MEERESGVGCACVLGIIILVTTIAVVAYIGWTLVQEVTTREAISQSNLAQLEGTYEERVDGYAQGKVTWPSLTVTAVDSEAGSFVIDYVVQTNDANMNPQDTIAGSLYCEINETLGDFSTRPRYRAVGENDLCPEVWGDGEVSIIEGVPTIQLEIRCAQYNKVLPSASATFRKVG